MGPKKSPGTDAARNAPSKVDVSMMVVMHDALRRDLISLEKVADRRTLAVPAKRESVANGWDVFKNQLHIHHTGEDTTLWPRLRSHLADRRDAIDLLDAMETEHNRIDPLIDAVDEAFESGEAGNDQIKDVTDALITELTDHLNHEEREALPLIGETLDMTEWQAVIWDMRRSVGLSGASEFFPWMLDEAPPEKTAIWTGILPPPARMLYKHVWNPRYHRKDRW